MKKILFSLLSGLALLSLLAASAQAQTTPVFFSLVSLTGSVNNRTITLVPDEYENPVVFGTNLAVLFPIQLQPVHGQVTTNLVPWGYSLTVDGWPRSVHIDVPYSTNVVPIISLINTNRFTPLNLYSTIVIGTNGILVWQTNGITTLDGSGLYSTSNPAGYQTAGQVAATVTAGISNLSTIATDTNVTADGAGNISASSLTATGTVSATTFAGAGTNLFYNQNASGALDSLYVNGFGYGQNGWVEIITNFSTGAGALVTVPPSPVGLYTAELSGRGGVLAYFATVSNTNYVTLAGAGTAIANGVYTWNGTAYSNAVTSCWITNAGSSAAYLLHAGTNLYRSVQFFGQMQPPQSASFSPLWLNSTFSGKQFYGSSPGPVSYPIVTLDFGQNNCLVTNLQYNSMTALATNTPVPISAHITNGVVTWTSP